MSNLNTVPEGAPLTYELINQIINAINELQPAETGLNQVFEAFGSRLGRGTNSNVIIATGEFRLNFGEQGPNQIKGGAARANITFPSGANFREKPYVLISMEDSGSDQNSFVVATMFDVKKSGFTVRARRLISSKKGLERDEIIGTFLAIGAGASGDTA